MKKEIFQAFLFAFTAAVTSFSQTVQMEPTPTPVKVVITNTMPPIKPAATPVPKPSQTPIIVGSNSAPQQAPSQNFNSRSMSFGQIKSRIAEAKRQMQTRPIATAMSEGTVMTDFVRVAFHNWKTRQLDYVVMTKESFLDTDAEKQTVSQNGTRLSVRTIRGNGVNTPIVLIDENGETHQPLLVQYPVEKFGKYVETAYYMSTHPGLVTPEVVNAGRYYVRNVIEIARDKLREKGIVIQPKVADIAERLAAVEHVDHQRFRAEYHPNIYNDVYALFALNEEQTYRYSVSSAGAGGMVQMIPATYRMVRSWHYNVPLMPDFVEGMRNHVNASQAMLLYMQRTWNDLIANPTVAGALLEGIATPEQLMAAGYNSNPARLAGYIKRGGENWTNLIPRETKIYLQIYESVDRWVPMKPRTR
ncbi:MAG: hypothetical protein ACR2M8_08485 [Pyrinomonadaceae bacterium]|nr:hypothetical protein [Acidobacteriota bacterium]